MTTPIPEAAVEAAARAIFNAEKGHGLALDATYDSALFVDQELRRRMARAALTAARPLMEAEAWDEGADAMLDAYDGERERVAERLRQIAEHYRMDLASPDTSALLDKAADMLTAGYRKPTLPSVDIDAAWEAHVSVIAPYHVDPRAEYDTNAIARGVAYETGFRAGATSVLDLFNPKEES